MREHIDSVINQINTNIFVGIKCGGIRSERDVERYKSDLIYAIKNIKVEIKNPETPEQEFERIIEGWHWHDKKDKDMVKAHTVDRRDLRKVLSAYKKGDYKKAYELAYHLDTLVRDMIPDRIWIKIGDEDLWS